jgi:hypothetical protein
MNLNLVQTLSTLPLVKHIESFLQTLHAYFAHYLKHYLEFTKLVKITKTKGHKIFHIVKIRWIFNVEPYPKRVGRIQNFGGESSYGLL